MTQNKQTGAMKIEAFGNTDVGRVRLENQDAFLVDEARGLFIVSDGMGGHQGGQVASRIVVEVLPRLLRGRIQEGASASEVEPGIVESLQELSAQMREQGMTAPALRGMGATAAMVLVRGKDAYLAHAGDSRIYLYQRGKLSQLTDDHSVVAMLLRLKQITPEQAAHHPLRGKLTRYLGMDGELIPEVKRIALSAPCTLLLCSDGLTGMLADERIASLLKKRRALPQTGQDLIDAANDAGGKDNITVLLLKFKPETGPRNNLMPGEVRIYKIK